MNQIAAVIGFPAITAVFYGLGLLELKKALQKTPFEEVKQKRIFNRVLYAILIWAILVSAWSLSGMMQRFNLFPLNMLPVLVIPLLTIVIIMFSPTAKEILTHVAPQTIIVLQSFRFFVEFVIWLMFIENMLPVQMTFEGRNFDIISGVTASLVAWLITIRKVNKWILIAWNLGCLGLLVNIVTVAILSMPTPLQEFFNEPVNILVAKFPYSFLPAFMVPLAYFLHFFSLKQLLMKRPESISGVQNLK